MKFKILLEKFVLVRLTKRFGMLSLITGFIVFYFSFEKFIVKTDNRYLYRSTMRISSIDLATLIVLRKNPKLICIDLREKVFYDNAHMPKAVNIPLREFEKITTKHKKISFNQSSDLIFYSNSKSINSIEPIIEFLSKRGIEEIKFYTGSWSEWRACNMPIEGNQYE